MLFAWISWSVDIAAASYLGSVVRHVTDGAYTADRGNAVWITLGGALLFPFGLIAQLWAVNLCCFREKEKLMAPPPPMVATVSPYETESTTPLNDQSSAPDSGLMKQRRSV